MIDRTHWLSIHDQARLLGLSRSSIYDQRRPRRRGTRFTRIC